METEKLNLLAEHYTHTFDFLQTHLKKRDKLFSGVLIMLTVMLFIIYTPKEISELANQILKENFKLTTTVNFLYIQSIIWFVLMALSIKYFQSVVFIERQYKYLHNLEDTLSKEFENGEFTREGKAYLNNYPMLLNWASFLYSIIFPFVFLVVTTSKIYTEFSLYGYKSILIWFNAVVFMFMLISLGLYFYGMHFSKKST
ncbi:MAG: hypothetical protein AB2657_17970 [Candidatus Thiodiazotropha endolucinida]